MMMNNHLVLAEVASSWPLNLSNLSWPAALYQAENSIS